MKDTIEQSAELKMALKHDPVTPALRAEAMAFPLEADEAYFECADGYDTASPDSWGRRGKWTCLGRYEAREAIPPAFTAHVGCYLAAEVRRSALQDAA